MLKLKIGKRKIFPSKKTLNLLQKDGEEQTPLRVVLMFCLLVILVFSVFKFGIFDQMYRYYSATTQANELEKKLEDAWIQNENYNDVYEEYARYYYTGFTEAESARVDRLQAIALIDEYLLTMGFAGAYTITDNVISLNLKGITLTQTATLIKNLTENEMVVSVPIQTAGSDVNSPQTVNMSVILKKAVEEQ